MHELAPTAPTPPESAPDIVRRAAALEATDWDGAIALLTEANRANRSDPLEIALAATRSRTFDRLASSQGPPAPPPDAGQPAPVGPSGLPEVTYRELTGPLLRASILGHGALVVRGAISADRAAGLATSIDASIAARDRARRGEGPSTADWRALPVAEELEPRLGRKWVNTGGGVLLCDAPRVAFELLELYTALGLKSVVAEYVGGRPVLSANKCTLRRVALDATGGWHQDGAFLGEQLRAVNIWLALTPCGVDAPGLDLVPRRFEQTLETGTGATYFDWAVGDDVVEQLAGDAGVVRPQFDAGDLLIFDELFLHRTAVSPEMTADRHAIEMWCFAASAYPNGHVPLVW